MDDPDALKGKYRMESVEENSEEMSERLLILLTLDGGGGWR